MYDFLLHLTIEQAARVTYVDGSFNFVAREHPYLYASLFKNFNRLLNIIL